MAIGRSTGRHIGILFAALLTSKASAIDSSGRESCYEGVYDRGAGAVRHVLLQVEAAPNTRPPETPGGDVTQQRGSILWEEWGTGGIKFIVNGMNCDLTAGRCWVDCTLGEATLTPENGGGLSLKVRELEADGLFSSSVFRQNFRLRGDFSLQERPASLCSSVLMQPRPKSESSCTVPLAIWGLG